jgi:uncharacterized Rmd1/YagE family protein
MNMNEQDLQEKYLEIFKDYSNIDKRLALMEREIHIIKDNHLSHIESDMKSINTKFNWAVGVVFVQLIGIISFLIFKM